MAARYWALFQRIAQEKDMTINGLAAVIDADCAGKSGLASAIRLYVLDFILTHPDLEA